MCSPSASGMGQGSNAGASIARINERAVLQPKSNQLGAALSLENNAPNKKKNNKKPTAGSDQAADPTSAQHHIHNSANAANKLSMKKPLRLSPAPTSTLNTKSSSPPIAATPPPAPPPLIKEVKHSITHQIKSAAEREKKPKKCPSSTIMSARSIAAARTRREQVSEMKGMRKMRIAHYGRVTKSGSKSEEEQKKKMTKKVVPVDFLPQQQQEQAAAAATITTFGTSSSNPGERRCTFITPTSDPLYVTYHGEEWGVPVHQDKLLFELLVLTSAQVGSDWTSVLHRRQQFREAFSWFNAEIVAQIGEKEMTSINAQYRIDMSLIRTTVDNSNRILQVKSEFGSFDKYLWRFVNNKPMCSGYKCWNKVPGKSSKSETISKDMPKRGFRFVGPTVIHSFMQAAGLSNDHLITCPRHLQISKLPT